jgi:hypothetical protein
MFNVLVRRLLLRLPLSWVDHHKASALIDFALPLLLLAVLPIFLVAFAATATTAVWSLTAAAMSRPVAAGWSLTAALAAVAFVLIAVLVPWSLVALWRAITAVAMFALLIFARLVVALLAFAGLILSAVILARWLAALWGLAIVTRAVPVAISASAH